MTDHLFVYGLLRKKANHEMSRLLSQNARFISEATFQGKLYLIDYYPGVLPSENPSDAVSGDLFQLTNPSVLVSLDQFEGIGAQSNPTDEYRRELKEVGLADGSAETAWIYMYNWTVQDQNEIVSGNFLEYLNTI